MNHEVERDFQNAATLAAALNLNYTPPVIKPAQSAVAFTENGALALPTTGSACLDFFAKITQSAEKSMTLELLERAWDENPLVALQTVAYLRSCLKGVPGQGARDPARTSYKWIIDNHPGTFNANMETFLKVGYWGDYKHLYDTNVWPVILVIWARHIIDIKTQMLNWLSSQGVTTEQYRSSPFNDRVPIDDAAKMAAVKYMEVPAKGQKRSDLNDLTAAKVINIGVWQVLEDLPQIEFFGAIKYVPPRQTGKNKPKTAKKAPNKVQDATVKDDSLIGLNNRIRFQLRKAIATLENRTVSDKYFRQVYLGLASHRLQTVEELVCAKHHDHINYSGVPSKANMRHGKSFKNHDQDRYQAHLSKVKTGAAKINTSRLHPHEVAHKARQFGVADDDQLDAWWEGVHQHLDQEEVFLDGWIPVVDVSGSMDCPAGSSGARCMDVSTAVGMLIAERNRGPLGGFFLNFSDKTRMIQLPERKTSTFRKRLKKMHEGKGYSTNFVGVATELITQYRKLQVKPEDTIKKVVVITDMQFNASCCFSGNQKTPFEAFSKLFVEAGYPVPTIVFWNVSSRNVSFPVYQGQAKVALISGFSSDLLYLLLKDEDFSPLAMMKQALNHDVYQQMVVVD